MWNYVIWVDKLRFPPARSQNVVAFCDLPPPCTFPKEEILIYYNRRHSNLFPWFLFQFRSSFSEGGLSHTDRINLDRFDQMFGRWAALKRTPSWRQTPLWLQWRHFDNTKKLQDCVLFPLDHVCFQQRCPRHRALLEQDDFKIRGKKISRDHSMKEQNVYIQ